MGKNIYLVIDTKKWAFDTIAKSIKKNAPKDWVVNFLYADEYKSLNELIDHINGADLVHFFLRTYLFEQIKHLKDIDLEKIKFFLSSTLITTGVHEQHLTYGEAETDISLNYLHDAYYVINKNLYKIYSDLPYIKSPESIIYDGIEIEKYKQKKEFNSEKIKIGWVGNSLHASYLSVKYPGQINYKDSKGFNTYFMPAINRLREKGYNLELCIADSAKKSKHIKEKGMVDFYKNIDIFVCSSKTDGTPLPILEAMASGNIIVSTAVGVVPEVVGKKQRKYIMLPPYTPNKFVKIFEELIKNKNEWPALSAENQKQILIKDTNLCVKGYYTFFDKVISSRGKKKLIAPSFVKIIQTNFQNNLREKLFYFLKKWQISKFLFKFIRKIKK